MTARSFGVAVAVLAGIARSAVAFGPASDFASAAAYDDGWVDGDEGGTGWDPLYPWTFLPTDAPFAVESSTLNGDGDTDHDGDIDTGGRAFTLRALGSGLGYAIRFLTPVPLLVGDRVVQTRRPVSRRSSRTSP